MSSLIATFTIPPVTSHLHAAVFWGADDSSGMKRGGTLWLGYQAAHFVSVVMGVNHSTTLTACEVVVSPELEEVIDESYLGLLPP